MPIQRYDGLNKAYDAGGTAGEFLRKIADGAANAACSLYRDHPGFVLPGDGWGTVTYPRAAARGLWDSLCGGRGALPQPPKQPFSGGQCVCATYAVRFRQTNTQTGVITEGTQNRAGKIGGIRSIPSVGGNPNRETWQLVYNIGCNGSPGLTTNLTDAERGTFKIEVLSVTRVDNGIDNCGSLPAQYPPGLPPTNKTYGNTNITNNDGSTFAIPFAYIPVTFAPEFSPNIRVDVGGVTVKFDLGGVDVYFPEEAPPPRSLPPREGLPPAPPNSPEPPPYPPDRPKPDTPGGNKRDSPDIQIDPPEQKPVPPGEGENPPPEPPEESDEQDAPGITYLEITLTKDPNKAQFGGKGETVYFGGWVAFRYKTGGFSPREQINFRKSVFKAPEGADGYTYTLTNGAQGFARWYTEKS